MATIQRVFVLMLENGFYDSIFGLSTFSGNLPWQRPDHGQRVARSTDCQLWPDGYALSAGHRLSLRSWL